MRRFTETLAGPAETTLANPGLVVSTSRSEDHFQEYSSMGFTSTIAVSVQRWLPPASVAEMDHLLSAAGSLTNATCIDWALVFDDVHIWTVSSPPAAIATKGSCSLEQFYPWIQRTRSCHSVRAHFGASSWLTSAGEEFDRLPEDVRFNWYPSSISFGFGRFLLHPDEKVEVSAVAAIGGQGALSSDTGHYIPSFQCIKSLVAYLEVVSGESPSISIDYLTTHIVDANDRLLETTTNHINEAEDRFAVYTWNLTEQTGQTGSNL